MKSDINFEAICKAILAFIEQNVDTPCLRQFRLTKKTLDGEAQNQDVGVWFVGDWVVERSKRCFVAHYDVNYGDGNTTRLILTLEKKGGNYSVSSWSVEEIF